MTTDTSEKGLESLTMRHLTGWDGIYADASDVVADVPLPTGGNGWVAGNPADYDREYAVDTAQFFGFLQSTQPEEFAKLGIDDYGGAHGIARRRFLARLQGEIARRGVVDVLRHGITAADAGRNPSAGSFMSRPSATGKRF